MACCGGNNIKVNERDLFEKLRKNGEEISLNLSNNRIIFLPKEGNWKSN